MISGQASDTIFRESRSLTVELAISRFPRVLSWSLWILDPGATCCASALSGLVLLRGFCGELTDVAECFATWCAE